MNKFDLTPDPNILVTITLSNLSPLNAISELIDNCIDSFSLARNSGNQIEHPLVLIEIPAKSDVNSNSGCFLVRDNGPGMSPEIAEKALKAGFSSKNPYDSLGLFGVGFNIATGKIGRITKLTTARKEDKKALTAEIDLDKLIKEKTYETVPELIEKPPGFEHGTIVEVLEWWPEGHPNYGFIRKLVHLTKPRIRDEIGRRYSTFLRENEIRIVINEEECKIFEHCIWNENRFVERLGHGKIPAVYKFDENVGTQTRCTMCFTLIGSSHNECQVCGSSSSRTINQKMRGWLGIQRFDSTTQFGIDLIRNGRVISMGERTAFFDFKDEYGKTIRDYPIDGTHGRIVGEVHLDFVPVDFLKQDFQRTSPEWEESMKYLRGESSLQPNQPEASQNKSPLYMLYQGYRRVRNAGKHDAYMGVFDLESKKSRRIGRDIEEEYFEKFKERLPGFYDDSEWWKLVESADLAPRGEIIECPNTECGVDNPKSAESCMICGTIISGKSCVSCNKEIVVSAISCPHCGKSQIETTQEPWTCNVCGKFNTSTAEKCISCESVIGSQSPLSFEYLSDNSDLDDNLSIKGCSVKLADGGNSTSNDVLCYITRKPIIKGLGGHSLPAVIQKISGEKIIKIFLDKQHPLFQSLGIRPEELIASETAYFLHVHHGGLSQGTYSSAHSLNNISWEILNKYWSDSLSDNPEKIRKDITNFFGEICTRLSTIFVKEASDLYGELTDEQQKNMIRNMIDDGVDFSTEIAQLRDSGKYMNYLNYSAIIMFFKLHTSNFFDGAVWNIPFKSISDISEKAMEDFRKEKKKTYLNCLEDCETFMITKKPEPVLVRRTRASLQYLNEHFEF
jgi:hypothetical protein